MFTNSYRKLRFPGPTVALAAAATMLGWVCVPAAAQCEIADLWAADWGEEHFFGWKVGVSDDFNTVVIAAGGHNTYRGAAYIYVRKGGSWIEQAILTAPDPTPYSQFGRAAGISADGATVVVGEVFDSNKGGGDAGAAYVFEFDSSRSRWVQAAELLASDGEPSLWLGSSLALSADAGTVVVAARGDGNKNNLPTGAAYVFERPPDGWTDMHETFKLVATDQEPILDDFGESVAISPDGRFILVGDDGDPEAAAAAGAAYVFGRFGKGLEWIELQKLMASDAADFDNLGKSVAVSLDAATIIVGAKGVDDLASLAGAAYIFVRRGDKWVEEQKLLASDGAVLHRFSWSSDISDDGYTALIGNVKGTAYLFAREEGKWIEKARLNSGDENVMALGKSLDMLPDGSAAVLGAPNSEVNGTPWVGSAHIFDLTTPCPGDLDGDGSVGVKDLLILLGSWGPCADCADCPADLDDDCTVGVKDLLILLANWG